MFGTDPKASVVVYPVPFDAACPYRVGSSNGPQAVFNAAAKVPVNVDVYFPDPATLSSVKEASAAVAVLKTAGDLATCEIECQALQDEVYLSARSTLQSNQKFTVLGGDHGVVYGSIKAHLEAFPEASLIHFDAHLDAVEPDSKSLTWASRSLLWNVVTQLAPRRVTQVGGRDYSSAEKEWLGNRGIQVFSGEPGSINLILDATDPKVYITFDIDSLDGVLCPHAGSPVPGGLLWNDLTYMLECLARDKTIVGVDLVGVAPTTSTTWDASSPDPYDAIVGARLLAKLIEAMCGSVQS
jgi:agmatinase